MRNIKVNIWHILTGALLLRILFMLYGAELFYGKEHFYITDDSKSFWYPLHNLVEHGLLTIKIGAPGGEIARMPGFSFYLFPFYYFYGEDIIGLFRAVAIFQILLDVLSLWLIYKSIIRFKLGETAALWVTFIIAIYPFSIVWVPVGQAECLSIFIISLSLFIYSGKSSELNMFLLGLVIAAGFFVRPQLIFLLPAILISTWIVSKKIPVKWAFMVLLGFASLYIWWPLRNYLNHDKLVFTRDITTMRDWQEDVIYFQKYMNAMQVGWEPQMTQIISYMQVKFPGKAFHSEDVEEKLKEAVWLSRICSDGFATFRYKTPLKYPCTERTAALWKNLYEEQVKADPFGNYVIVPLKALKKAFFKLNMVENWKSPERKTWQNIAYTLLFSLRSLLILIGLYACIKLINTRDKRKNIAAIALIYFLSWYGYLAFVIRFMEMRYLLQADLLLLIPVGIWLAQVFRSGTQLG